MPTFLFFASVYRILGFGLLLEPFLQQVVPLVFLCLQVASRVFLSIVIVFLLELPFDNDSEVAPRFDFQKCIFEYCWVPVAFIMDFGSVFFCATR